MSPAHTRTLGTRYACGARSSIVVSRSSHLHEPFHTAADPHQSGPNRSEPIGKALMLIQTAQTITYLADITDPTSDGILVTLVNFGLGALAVITAGVGGYYAFNAWQESKGRAAALKGIREVLWGVLALEALYGVIFAAANYGSNILSVVPGLGG